MIMSKKTLIMVDNDSYYAAIYAKRFTAVGWKVFVEQTIEDVKKRLARTTPEVLIADIDLEGDVFAFFSSLRDDSATKDILQVLLVDVGDRHTLAQSQRVGIDEYVLKKEFTPALAVKKIKRLLEQKLSV